MVGRSLSEKGLPQQTASRRVRLKQHGLGGVTRVNGCGTPPPRGIDAAECVQDTQDREVRQNPSEGVTMSPYPPPVPPARHPTRAVSAAASKKPWSGSRRNCARLSAYVNDAVVPQVRRESITAMRTMADTLRNLADRFEASSRPGGAPPNPAPPIRPSNPSKDPRS